jgi:epoxyqueuosine reductase
MGNMSLTSEIREYARSCGAEIFGVTSAAPFGSYLDTVAELESIGKFQGLPISDHINTSRADARNALRSARSIIVVGVPYKLRVPSDDSRQHEGPHVSFGRYWLYARNARRVFGDLDHAIAGYMQKQGFEAKAVGNRGIPLKPAAVRAGLANYGKNAIVYTEEFGSWVWWFGVVTEADLEHSDAGGEDICGKCDRCVKACPTGALYEAYKLDALRCMTYLTHPSMQDVGEIEDSLKEKIGNCLCGCEICQDVCPLNRKVKPIEVSATPDFSHYGVPLPDREKLPLSDLIGILKGECSHYFQRYAAICIGNLKEADSALPVLTAMLSSEDELVRKYADWAIDRIKRRKPHID